MRIIHEMRTGRLDEKIITIASDKVVTTGIVVFKLSRIAL
jgi:hypothetical protein